MKEIAKPLIYYFGSFLLAGVLKFSGEGIWQSFGAVGFSFFSFITAALFWGFLIGFILVRLQADELVVALGAFFGASYFAYISVTLIERLIE